MNASWSHFTQAPLYDEHLLLGGIFEGDDPLLATPVRYGDASGEADAFSHGCALCDLSGMTGILVSGPGADSFVAASCANDALAVGECAFGAVVTGDGSIASVPLVARTGDQEYLIWDASERGLMLQPWLGFLRDIEQDGFRPFGEVEVEDVSDALVPLLLWGPDARAVLADYVSDVSVLPAPGCIRNVRLDRIECLVAAPSNPRYHCMLVLAPPAAARALWRSFLSFTQVNPVGTFSLAAHATQELPWMEAVLASDRLELALDQLLDWGLARTEGGYVGHRALLG